MYQWIDWLFSYESVILLGIFSPKAFFITWVEVSLDLSAKRPVEVPVLVFRWFVASCRLPEYQNITHTEFALCLFPQSTIPNMEMLEHPPGGPHSILHDISCEYCYSYDKKTALSLVSAFWLSIQRLRLDP